jgi:rSAM/selenodomain-associated transferase 2
VKSVELLELSVIVPVLNEAAGVSKLFTMLARQQGVAFELIVCDGGSTDDTIGQAQLLFKAMPFPCRLLQVAKGRARQLNAGARAAAADNLLFLHADSVFPDPLALRQGLDALRETNGRRAGRFALRFDVPAERYGFGYYFYEAKARLGRPEGIHGDQGYLLSRDFFVKLGGFDETLELLEDNRFAEAVRREGGWLLLPAEIVTSARRFETEGLTERQTLNALLMNFAAIGWDDFFRLAPDLYRSQKDSGRLQLMPFFRCICELLRSLPVRKRFLLWSATGRYVRGNAWQIPFSRDVRCAFRRGLPPGQVPTPRLDWHDRWFDRLTDHAAGRLAAAVLVWGWFHLTYIYLRRTRSE